MWTKNTKNAESSIDADDLFISNLLHQLLLMYIT